MSIFVCAEGLICARSHLFFMFASMLHWIDQIYDLPHVAALSSVLALGKRHSWLKAQLNSQNFHSVFFFFFGIV